MKGKERNDSCLKAGKTIENFFELDFHTFNERLNKQRDSRASRRPNSDLTNFENFQKSL